MTRKSLTNTITFLIESPGSVQSKKKDMDKAEELQTVLSNLDQEEEKELKAVQSKKQLSWPCSTMTGTLRTVDLIKYTVSKIVRNIAMNKHEKKGLTGQSHLLYQPDFHFINCLPAEYMHLGCLGVVKRLTELTFDVGECRQKTSKRKLSEAAMFNKLIKKIESAKRVQQET